MSRPKKLPEFLTQEEQEEIIKQPNPRYITGERNKLLLIIMLQIGTRLSETINLEWKHIDMISGKVMIREGKGSKDRTVWVDEKTIDLLQLWKQRQAEYLKERQDFIFTTNKGTKLLPRYVQQMVERYSKKAGIEKNVTPHTLRHTFATDLYRNTKNILMTQKALGHSDVSTTMIYTHVVDDELEFAMKNFRMK